MLLHSSWDMLGDCYDLQTAPDMGCSIPDAGNLRSTDQSGPFNLSLLPAQVAEVKGTTLATVRFA